MSDEYLETFFGHAKTSNNDKTVFSVHSFPVNS